MSQKIPPYRRDFLLIVLLGLALMLVPLAYPVADYDDLRESQVVVSQLDFTTVRETRNYSLTTDTGQRMELRGELSPSALEDALTPGTTVTVKYYHGRHWLSPAIFVRELTCNGQTMVAFDGNRQTKNQVLFLCLGLGVIVLDLLLFLPAHYRFRMQQNKQQRRQEKLRRKYGEHYRPPKSPRR